MTERGEMVVGKLNRERMCVHIELFHVAIHHCKAITFQLKIKIYCHPAYLTCMQRTSCEMLGWMKLKTESDCWEKYQNLRYTDDTTFMAESKELKSLVMKVKRRVKKLS